jgi:Xaa-Pro aminopeptidase
VLIDAGCELDGYASDITRTFPANGQFTGPQRALYDLVLASQDAAVAATKPGARFNDPHDATVAVLAQGMLDVGLLDKNKVGTVEDVIDSAPTFSFTCTAPATGWAWMCTTAAATWSPARWAR